MFRVHYAPFYNICIISAVTVLRIEISISVILVVSDMVAILITHIISVYNNLVIFYHPFLW